MTLFHSLLLGVCVVAVGSTSAKAQSNLNLWFTKPAESYLEACPVGNGRLGAMPFGGVSQERVVLNEQTMWSGSPDDNDRENAYKVLPEIRRLLFAGENRKAQELLYENFLCKGAGSGSGNGKDVPFGCYQTLGDLQLELSGGSEVVQYHRDLDLDTAITTTTYEQSGTKYRREVFASGPDQVIVYRLTADKPGSLSLLAKLSRKERVEYAVEGTDFVMGGQLNNGKPDGKGVRYQARLRAVCEGGSVTVGAGGISIQKANSVTLLISAGTDLGDKEFLKSVLKQLDSASKRSYASLKSRSVKDHQSFFRRMSLSLPKSEKSSLSTPERVKAMSKGSEDPDLQALYFQYGRYLLICSSRPDSPFPANLQGIWADDYQTAWNGDWHLDINVQMNYWLAEATNLSDCHLPLVRFIKTLVEPGKKTAKAYYNSRGWVSHVISNPWGYTAPGEGASWGSTCSGGGWLCWHLWAHYQYTLDKDYLRSVYPVLKEASLFFSDMMVQEPKHGWLVTAPSNSPENAYVLPNGDQLNTCMGPTMDNQIVRELFSNTIEASKILGEDAGFRAELEAKRAKLAPTQIGKHGQIMEWLEDYDEAEPHHRHTSNLYGLHPSNQIDSINTPELAKAARVTLERRGDESTGWSMAWKTNFWARLLDGDHANTLCKLLIGRGAANLFCLHPPFQIDGNFGGTAGMAEMLLQNRPGEIHLMPAVPSSWKARGSVKGLKAHGGYTVDFEWVDGHVTKWKVRGKNLDKVKVRVNGELKSAA